MKKRSIIFELVLTILLLTLIGSCNVFAEEKGTLILGWEEWPPFQYRDSKQKLVGLDIDLITTIFTEAGYSVQYKEAPWKRQLVELKTGTIDIVSSAMKLPEREIYAYYSDEYQKEYYQLFVRKEDVATYQLHKLFDIITKQMDIGIMRGVVYGDEFNQLMKNPGFKNHIQEVTSDIQNYKKLLNGRIDGLIQEYSVFATQSKKEGVSNRFVPVLDIKSTNLYAIFSKKNNDLQLVQVFNKGLKELRQNGKYQQLFEKYELAMNSLKTIQE